MGNMNSSDEIEIKNALSDLNNIGANLGENYKQLDILRSQLNSLPISVVNQEYVQGLSPKLLN